MKRPPGKRPVARSPLRPLPLDPTSPLYEALQACLGRVEVSLNKWPPEAEAAKAAIDRYQEECAARRKSPNPDRLAMSLSEIGLSSRTLNLLTGHGIETVGDLVKMRREELLAFPRVAKAVLQEIMLALERLGFELPPPEQIGMC